ncbi:MAG: PilW family protein [Acidiferrobacterales bacterium]
MPYTSPDHTPSTTMMRPAGFTLVELMVALTIGIIILGALSQVFVTSRSTYIIEEGLARVQENGRFAMNFITEDIRMAGYMGCQDQAGKLVNQLNDPLGDYWPVRPTINTPSPVVTGFNYTGGGGDAITDWTPNLPGAYFAAGEVQPFTDVIMIRRGSDQTFQTVAPWMNQPTDPVPVPAGATLQQWDIVMVANCEGADIFRVTNATADIFANGLLAHTTAAPPDGPANQGLALSQTYDSRSEVFTLVTNAYFVGTGNGTGTNVGNFVPALFRKQISAGSIAPAELVDNVDNLQVLFGVDGPAIPNDGVADQYLDADAVNTFATTIIPANWISVASVRVGLLIRTPDEHGGDYDTNNTYDVAGTDVDPTPGADDRRQRRVFTSTVNVRNYTLFTRAPPS